MDTFAWSIVMAVAVLAMCFAFAFFGGYIESSPFKRKSQPEDPKAQENLLKVLKRYGNMKNFEVLGKTTLQFEDTSYTFDAILLGFFGTIGVKSISLQGEIYGQSNSDTWMQVFRDKKTEFKNPTQELNGSVRFFKELYKAEKVKCGNGDSVVAFTSKNVLLFTGKNTAVVALDKLYAKLDTTKYLTDNGADVAAMKAALEKYTVK